jgi:hypothetical protein
MMQLAPLGSPALPARSAEPAETTFPELTM